MNKFKVGDKVKYKGVNDQELRGQTGTMTSINTSSFPHEVAFEGKTGECFESSLELAEPTTLERLAEFEKSGEEFMIVGGNIVYKFIQGKLVYDNLGNAFSLATINEVLKFGIKEISWTPKEMPWKPKENETFFFINTLGEISETYFSNDSNDKGLIKAGNYFKTKKLADIVRNQILEILKEASHG